MYSRLITLFTALSLTGATTTLPATAAEDACSDVQIPITVSTPRFIIDTTIQDDWDTAALTLNLTRRDFSKPTDPLPVVGVTSDITSTYHVGATLCGTGSTMLVLTHGIIESKLYWRPTFANSANYSFVDAAIARGYSVLYYDRIGVGSSSKIDAVSDAQFQVETAVLNSLVDYARTAANATKVGLIGHSYGSYLSAASAGQTNVDALILTGFSGTFDFFAPFLAGAGLRVARLQNASRWGDLDSAYMTSSDLYAETYVYFAAGFFEHHVAEWTYSVASEPFALGELPSLLNTTIEYGDVTAPVYVLLGQYDVSACGGDCIGLLNATAGLFSGAKVVETVDNLQAGHNLNLHLVAPQSFEMMFDFLKAQDL